jgi:small GTP-binding protein
MGDRPRKVVLVGSVSVGKTALMTRIADGRFDPNTEATACAAYAQYTHPATGAAVQLWDTAGLERYRSLNKIYYRDASAALLTFDLTVRRSFDDVSAWKEHFEGEVAQRSARFLLVGNKADLRGACEVPEEEARAWASDHKAPYFAVSALTGEGVAEMLDALVRALPQRAEEPFTQIAEEEPDGRGCC